MPGRGKEIWSHESQGHIDLSIEVNHSPTLFPILGLSRGPEISLQGRKVGKQHN